MRKVSIGAILAATVLMLFAVPAHAQFGGGGLLPELPDPGNKPPSEAYCTQYAAEAVQLAQHAGGLSAASMQTRRNGRPMRRAKRPLAAPPH
jgi:hypothetical protein